MSTKTEESFTNFTAKTREWLNSLNTKPNSNNSVSDEDKSNPYHDLDSEQSLVSLCLLEE